MEEPRSRPGERPERTSDADLVILGTSSQVPTRRRNHNGYLLRWGRCGFLFDPGEGTQRQLIHAGVAPTDITHIVITHFHGDHCLGVPGILQRLTLDKPGHRVTVVHPASGAHHLRALRDGSIHVERIEVVPQPVESDGEVLRVDDLVLSAARLNHPVDTFGYRIEEDPIVTMDPTRLKALGIVGRQIGQLKADGKTTVDGREVTVDEVSTSRPGRSFAFIMDTGPCAATVDLAREATFALIESTYLSEYTQEAIDRGHLTATLAAQIAADAGVERLILTHFSQRHRNPRDFVREARPIHANVVAARDCDRFDFPHRRGKD